MCNSICRRQVVILDCCFSGAFAKGWLAKDDGSVDIKNQLGGEGKVVLTSSTHVQSSLAPQGSDLSTYTRYLVEGLETAKDDNPNPPQPEEPPSKDQPKPNDKRKKALLVTGGGIVTTLAVVGIGGIYWQFQSKFPPCSPTENLCKIFPQVGNGKEDPWVYPNTSSNPKDKPFTSPSPYVSSNDRDCGGSSSPVLKLK